MTAADIFIAMPLMLLAVGALAVLLTGAVTHSNRAVMIIGVTVLLGAACWLLRTPPALTALTALTAPTLGLSAGELSRLFGVYFALLAAGVLCLSAGYNRAFNIHGEEYPATILFVTFGMIALASATNLLTLFLGLEAMSFGFYILVAIDLNRDTSGETGLKYLLPGALSAAFLVFGIALIYCVSGTLTINGAVQLTLTSGRPDPIALAGWGCLLIGIAFKLSLAPAHLWTPDVYQGAPAPVTAFLSGGSKVATVLLLLLLLPQAADISFLRAPLWGLAVLSILTGNLAALLQSRVRRLLAYSSIAQMGYVVVAIVSGRGGGFQAAAFYVLSYGLISLAAFGAISIIERRGCGETLDDYRGLGRCQPFASGVLALAMFALAGIPPTLGFTGKFLIFTAAVRSGEITLAVIGIILAAVSVFYYLRVVVTLYCKHSTAADTIRPTYPEYVVLTVAAAVIILLGLWPNALIILLSRLLP